MLHFTATLQISHYTSYILHPYLFVLHRYFTDHILLFSSPFTITFTFHIVHLTFYIYIMHSHFTFTLHSTFYILNSTFCTVHYYIYFYVEHSTYASPFTLKATFYILNHVVLLSYTVPLHTYSDISHLTFTLHFTFYFTLYIYILILPIRCIYVFTIHCTL